MGWREVSDGAGGWKRGRGSPRHLGGLFEHATLLRSGELSLDQAAVDALLRHQRVVTAHLRDLAGVEHHHPVGVFHRREPGRRSSATRSGFFSVAAADRTVHNA